MNNRTRGAAIIAAVMATALGLLLPAGAMAAPFDLGELEDSFLRFDGEIYSAPGAEVEEGDMTGEAVVGDCDITGDGAVDIAIGAPASTVGAQTDAGRIYIVPGGARAPGSYSLSGAAGQTAAGSIEIEGFVTAAGRKLGSPLACAGDVNGDGADDLLVGAPEAAPTAAYVIFGGPALVAAGNVAIESLGSHGFRIEGGEWLGAYVAGLGDLDGDGKDEIAVGDPWGHFEGREYVGAVSVVAGRADTTTVDLNVAGSTLMRVGGVEGDEVSSVAAAGDVDGDGVGDLLVGAPPHAGPNGPNSGAVYVISGTARGAVDVSLYAEPGSAVLFPIWGGPQRSIGRTLAGVGDVDGDGLDDLAIAEGRFRTDSGGAYFYAVHVVYGKKDDAAVDTTTLRSGGFTVSGRHDPNSFDEFGAALAGAGDVNGDGHADIAIGAPSFYKPVEPGKGPAAGAAYLIYGGAHPVDAEVADLSCEQGAEVWGNWIEGLGKSIASAGDFDGSGEPQLLIGATRFVSEGNGHYALVAPLGDLADGCEAEEPPVVSGDSPEVDWGFRENFRRYVTNGFNPAAPAVPIAASGGAFCPANPDSAKGGCDPKLKALPADPIATGALRFTPVGAGETDGSDTTVATMGRVTFRYPGHFFTLKLEDPWFAIEGNEVTVRARMDLDVDPSFPAYQSADVRVDLGTFPLAGPAEVTPGYVKWKTGAGVLTPEAGAALGGFLGTGAELDPIALTIPRGIAELPEEPGLPTVPDPVDKPGANDGLGGGGGATTTTTVIQTTAPAAVAPPVPPRGRPVGDDGVARLSKLSCPAASCEVKVPKRVAVKIDGKRFWAKVMAPKTLAGGKKSPLRVKLPKPALTQLNGRSTTVKVRVAVRSGERTLIRVLSIKVRYVPGAKDGAAAKGGGSGGSTGSAPKSAPITTLEPPTLARPATAVDVSNVKITWFPRDSWVRYASSGVGPNDGIKVSGGATGLESKASPCPDRPSTSDALLAYGVEFTPKPSWYDPATGSAGVYGQGSVGFKWAAHTIDLNASDPEIEIAGAASRAVFRFSGSGGTPYPNQRASLVSLDTAGKPAVSNGGKTFTYSLMRGTLTADGVNVFAGFYTPPDNDEFGCMSVEFTTP